MIRKILDFFRAEKAYLLLLIVILTIYAYFWYSPQPQKVPKPSDSQAFERFREAEARLQEKVESAGSLESFLKQKPVLEALFHLVSFLVTGAFTIGLILDFFLLFNPAWRRSLGHAHSPPETTEWKFSLLFKIMLLFTAGSLGLSIFLGLTRYVLPWQMSHNLMILLHTTLVDAMTFLFMVVILREGGGNWRDLGFRIPEGKLAREIGLGLLGYMAVLPVFIATLVFLIYIASLFAYEPPPHPLVNVFLEEEVRRPALVVYSVFLATVVGPVFEEIFFRGLCYPVLKKSIGMFWAMVVSSAFFALIHANTFAFWPIFILGIGLVYLYEKRRSLVAPIVLHVAHNTVFITYFFLAKTLITQESGGL